MTAPSPFSSKLPHLQLVWDSTSLSLLKTCPQKYFQAIIQGWRPKHTAPPLTYGQLVHKGLERYDVARAKGESHDQAIEQSLWQTLHEAGTLMPTCLHCGLVQPTNTTETCSRCQEDCVSAETWIPLFSDNTKPRTIETLCRTLLWYWEHFRDDPARTVILADGKPAVELSFRFDLGFESVTGEPFMLSGHLDRLVEFAGATWVMDRKTTATTISSYFFDKFTPDNQMSLYSLASQVVWGSPVRGVMIDGIQIAQGFTRFSRGFANRSPAQLSEWLAETKAWLRMAEAMASGGWWPRNDTSCHQYSGCQFRPICGRDPSVRQNFLESDFKIDRWNPLETR